MLRTIIAVVCGYFVMVAIVLITSSLALVAPDFAMQPESNEPTLKWCVYQLVAGAAAAIAGGYFAAMLSPGKPKAAVYWLAGLILVFGLASGIAMRPSARPEGAGSASESSARRLSEARQPLGMVLALPVVGAAGVLAGGKLRMNRQPAREGEAAAA